MRAAKAFAVIGAGWGDEGKGLVVDAITARENAALVVRTNGGAQAGHTVVTPDGLRHVFSHFGSGSLAGAATHLSRFFVANPVLFGKELDQLRQKSARTDVSIDPAALVTTPFDMLINQMIERRRGAARHGSCGVGFGETIERSTRHPAIVAQDTGDAALLRQKLLNIRDYWVASRLREFGIELMDTHEYGLLFSDALVDAFIHDCETFRANVQVVRDDHLALDGPVVIEGAQGLMLDQDYGHFPHVTRSNTGLRQMVAFAAIADIPELSATFVTRAYATRHGSGPFSNPPLSGFNVVDETNSPNDWQGDLRVGTLELTVLANAIAADLERAGHPSIRAEVVVTCLDQAGEFPCLSAYGTPYAVEVSDVAREIHAWTSLPVSESWGPTRATLGPRRTEWRRAG